MTSNDILPQRLTQVDELIRPDHSYLTPDDTCYFLGEYTARKGFSFSATNNLIINLKKSVSCRGQYQWRYKSTAIKQAAIAFHSAVNEEALNDATLVPIPPSKVKTDPLYDDRMTQVIREIRPSPPLDVRELIIQRNTTEPAHSLVDGNRPRPEDILALYDIDQNLVKPHPRLIALFDDVLTTGAHFKAAKSVLIRAFPGIDIVGLFIARRVPEAVDIEDVFA